MNKRTFAITLLVIAILSGCTKQDPPLESSIYMVNYSIDEVAFIDTTLVYNFNGDRWDDFTMELSWVFDTTGNDYTWEGDTRMYFNYYSELECGMSDWINFSSQKKWQPGDTVYDPDSFQAFSISSGGFMVNTNNIDLMRAEISMYENNDVYWAYYLEAEGGVHYGWARLRCGVFVETAFNLVPEEPIIIGQRE